MQIIVIYKQSAFVLITPAVQLFLRVEEIAAWGILIGGGLVANSKGLAWVSVDCQPAAGNRGIGFFSLIRFFIMTAILIILLWLKIINIAGILSVLQQSWSFCLRKGSGQQGKRGRKGGLMLELNFSNMMGEGIVRRVLRKGRLKA